MKKRRHEQQGQQDGQPRKQQPEPERGSAPDGGEFEPALRTPPAVWIGSLADYNNGRLTGEWVEAAVDGEELEATHDALSRAARA